MGAAASGVGDDAMENTVSPELMVCGLVISSRMSLRLITYGNPRPEEDVRDVRWSTRNAVKIKKLPISRSAREVREVPWRRESVQAGWLPAADRAISFSKA